ncbi:MAG: SPFH domain-containing protein [Candidatus Brennerbacteria bacterium]
MTIIPAYHFGVVERFGERIAIFREGLNFKIPLIDKIELISLELSEIPTVVSFTTKDRLPLQCNGSLQYRPDPDMGGAKNVFVTMSEDIVTSGIKEAIKAKLGSLGGTRNAEEFIVNRNAIADLINATLRMKVPPHLNHDKTMCGAKIQKKISEQVNVVDCDLPQEVLSDDLLEYYRSHWRTVKKIIDEERSRPTDRSAYEERYGIDIVAFALADVDFSEETKKAFEKEQQAKARRRAFTDKIEMAKEAKNLGASAQEALNAADVSLDPSIKKSVLSVEGETGVLGGFIGALTQKKGGD